MAMQQDMEHTWDSKVAINRILIIRLYGCFLLNWQMRGDLLLIKVNIGIFI
jgi:hypothetical protein